MESATQNAICADATGTAELAASVLSLSSGYTAGELLDTSDNVTTCGAQQAVHCLLPVLNGNIQWEAVF